MRTYGVVALLGLWLFGCQAAEECKGFTSSNDGESVWSQCGDKKLRKVNCEGLVRGALIVPGKPVTCACSVDGAITKKFETSDPVGLLTVDPGTKLAADNCGWQLKR